MYGKIARLSYKEGFCWASNTFLDGTESGRTASRQIAELKEAGYISVIIKSNFEREIRICDVASTIPLAKNGEPPSPKMANPPRQKWRTPLAKNGDITSLINTLINKEKEQENFIFSSENSQEEIQNQPAEPQEVAPLPPELPPDKKAETKEDVITVFNKARVLWNELKLPSECRDMIPQDAFFRDCIHTFQNYTWAEIENAIKNFSWHKKGKGGVGYEQPPSYQSIYGFLKTGVAKYYDDDATLKLFRKPER